MFCQHVFGNISGGFCGISRNFAEIPEFRGSATAQIIRSPEKGVVGIDKVVNFKGFLRPNKEIKYFSRTLAEFKDFSRWLVKFNDLYKIIQTMLPLTKINTNLGGTRPLSTIPSPISLTCNFPPFWSKMRCYRKQITLQLILTKSLLNQTKRLWKQRKW